MNPEQDLDRSWRKFSASIIAVLGASVLGVLLVVAGITALQLGDLASGELDRRAGEIARFISRAAFVPVSLGDQRTLERIVQIYAVDRDVVAISVSSADGKLIVKRDFQPAESGKNLAVGTRPISPPEELRRGPETAASALGVVQVVMSGTRVRATMRRSLAWVLLAALVLTAAAVLLSLALISRMTASLKAVLDRARRADELARSNVDLEQFAYVASHDLQEPLRKVVSFSELLRRRYASKLDAEGAVMLDLVVDGGFRMRNLIMDLLSYARVQSQAHPLVPTETEPILREARESIDESAKEARAVFAFEPLPAVLGDPSQLRQVFQNLLSNAVKFHKDGMPPEVRVSARRDGSYWVFMVADNGIGIPAKFTPQAFQMMRRFHPRNKYPGTGIGLALCKRIIERHGGRIWLESEPDRGTTIFFTLPDAKSPAVAKAG